MNRKWILAGAGAVGLVFAVDHVRVEILNWLDDLDAFKDDANPTAIYKEIDSHTGQLRETAAVLEQLTAIQRGGFIGRIKPNGELLDLETIVGYVEARQKVIRECFEDGGHDWEEKDEAGNLGECPTCKLYPVKADLEDPLSTPEKARFFADGGPQA